MLAYGDALSASPIAPSIPPTNDLPKLTRATFIGILIAITGNILISLSLNLQKLAHKRVEAKVRARSETEIGNAVRRHPSLDEHDEDSVHETIPPNSTASGTAPAETEPLIPFSHSLSSNPAYGSLSPSPSGSTWNELRPRSSFASRLVPSWLRRHKREPHPSDAPYEATIPVYVMSEEDGLRQQLPTPRQKSDILEDGHETEYLKSKLWFVPTRASLRDLLGILIAIIGAVTVVLASNASDTRLDPATLLDAICQTPFIVYSGVYLVGGVILGTLSERDIGRRWVFIDVGICALFGGNHFIS
ncbi:hypothetical protein C0991_005946 [Blastosporella zonata]|nr:hypothetical protein C0991_005946 [Blastosporella zonata]